MKYINRFIEETIARKMRVMGAVVIAGPKFCGKTTTSQQFAKSCTALNNTQLVINATIDPNLVLVGEKPHLIDEWQLVPDIWNYVKADLDKEYVPGKFILTGSSTPVDKSLILHTGAGRIVTVKMKPMTLAESNESDCSVSLSGLFNNKPNAFNLSSKEKSYDDTLFYMCRGGWPLSVEKETRTDALEMTSSYCSNLFNFENNKNKKFRNKNNSIFNILLKSCARNVSTPVKVSTIMNDIIQREDRETFNRKTFNDYMEALHDLYILEYQESWNPNLRSKTILTASPIMHFVDTSIACNALGATPEKLKQDPKTAGLLFEDFVLRDLSVYASLLGGEIKHYRDNNGLECDAVILLPDGKWAAVEIKLGGILVNDAIKTLNKFANNIETLTNYGHPTFKMIVTASGMCYKTKEGIYVVPITCLGK